jgi:hypothetical protein
MDWLLYFMEEHEQSFANLNCEDCSGSGFEIIEVAYPPYSVEVPCGCVYSRWSVIEYFDSDLSTAPF